MPTKCDTTFLFYSLLCLSSTIALIFGALSWSRTLSLSLPLPTWLPVLTTLLSPLTVTALAAIGILIPRTPTNAAAANSAIQRALFFIDQAHSILSTIIATLALAYLFPENILSCHLDHQWQSYFSARNAAPIRSIQDTFQCCGLRSIHDRAWPFKDKAHGDDACEKQLGFRRSCFEPWREQQRSVSWMIFVAAVLVWGVKVGYIQVFRRRNSSWMDRRAARGASDYQRITNAEGHEHEEDGDLENHDAAGENRRTILPQANPEYTGSNEWTER
ncbi:hypothetical protein P170DRAFT_507261 [Aspergillus steynii IBT 23096]|uniref:Tetraspanin Tsp3 n=1 Tax=Aspergillus steynii IBT 23096 TaxID=1392250 RepID=A0A2I2GHX0_9EURO|nr:uncharacterized protein P170DRAFT_507261 [Aspergillus steynii IBT 23096]PLB52469.1 hypothetical protein P170DRAFT_507261 [Aspergillus steynii IBT 23096]